MQLSLPLDTIRRSPKELPAKVDRVSFVRHRRARRYILRVLDDGTLRVTLPRRGSKREAEAFVERSASWIAKQRGRLPQLVSPKPSAFAASRLRRDKLDEQGLRRRASTELPPALLALAHAHHITVTRISVRNQRSRWGACSARGSITLNWRLILVPDFVREYVMIHELMHRRELNHSSTFWRQVAAACPGHEAARRWLGTEGQRLFRGGELC